MVFRAVLALLLVAAPAVAEPVLFARGAWVAVDRGSACLALTRSDKIAAKDKVQASAGFAFTPDGRRLGEFHARLSRVPRAGAAVVLSIGGQPFLLVSRGDWAWSRDRLQEQAIIGAARNGGWFTVESRDLAGTRFVDPYALDGAATAIDAAAARCAFRAAGKIK